MIDVDVFDIVQEAMMKNDIKEKEREEIEKRQQEDEKKVDGYLAKVRDMVRQTHILKEIPPEEFAEHENHRKKKRKGVMSIIIVFSVQ